MIQRQPAPPEVFADALPQLAWVARPDGFIYWYNRRWHEYTGTTPEQVQGWGWTCVHDPSALPKVLEQWQLSIASGKTFELEFPLRDADGRFRPFLTRAAPVRDADGQITHWVGTNTDVSAQKEAEERMRHSEASLRLALNAAYLIAFEWDIARNEVWRHHNADELMGRTEKKPDTYETVRGYVHPGPDEPD